MKTNDIRVEEIRRFRYSFLPASVWYTASRKDARLDLFILKTAAFQLESSGFSSLYTLNCRRRQV